MALRELLARFGFDVDIKPLKDGDKAVSGFSDKIATLGKTLGGVAIVKGLYDFTKSLINVGSELDDSANRLGISAEELQMWRFGAEQAGISAEELSGGLKLLTKNLAEAAGGGAPAADFAAMGLSVRGAGGQVRDATAVISDIADKVAKAKTSTEAAGIAFKAFGRSGINMVPLLKQGAKGVAEMRARFEELGGGLSNEFVKAADDAGDSLVELNVVGTAFKNQLGIHLLPIVSKITKGLTDFAIAAKNLTKESYLMEAAFVVLGVAGLVAASSLLPLVFEIVAVVAAMTLWALILDDVITFLNGGDSAIGRFLDGMFGVGTSTKVLETLKEAWKALAPAIDTIGAVVKAVGTIALATLKGLFNGFKGWVDDIRVLFEEIWKDVGKFFGNIKSVFTSLPEILQGKGKTASLTVNDILEMQANVQARDAQFGPPTAPGGAQGNPVDITQTNHVSINIDGAGDPAMVAQKTATLLGTTNTQNMDAFGAMARP